MRLPLRTNLIMNFVIFILLAASTISCNQQNWQTSLPVDNKTPAVGKVDPQTPVVTSDYYTSINTGNMARKYWVHLPSAYNNKQKWPMVIQLHGGGGEGKHLNALTGYYALADKEGFLVVSPDAIEKNWNDGRGGLNVKSHTENIDDVAFISELIDKSVAELNADPKRVYVTGISNGALMSHRLGCELSSKIAAIAPVAGNFPYQMAAVLSPSRPVPVLIINGTDDPLVPYNGGYVTFGLQKRGQVLSVDDTIKFWVKNNGCNPIPDISNLPDVSNDGTSVTVYFYRGCSEAADIILYEIKDGGHTWPRGLQYLPAAIIGKTCHDFNASNVIWDFFRQHPMQ